MRLDHCNAVFYSTTGKNFDKLQRVQNTIAHVVKERIKYDHITPLFSKLHWLPIEAHIRHKIRNYSSRCATILRFNVQGSFDKQAELSG